MTRPNDPAVQEYQRRYDRTLQHTADKLESYLRELLSDAPNIDRIAARAKDPASFRGKAGRTDDDGHLKYTEPLEEIQDQIGARVIVLYQDDVSVIEQTFLNYVSAIELESKAPESVWQFGYFGRHLLLALPGDVLPDQTPTQDVPDFFELQIKTVFQHAWSEANHDLGYKAPVKLDVDQTRLLAFAASQAWGADRALNQLCREVGGLPRQPGATDRIP